MKPRALFVSPSRYRLPLDPALARKWDALAAELDVCVFASGDGGDATFRLDPTIPASWPRYTIVWKFGRSRYQIEVENPEHLCRGIRQAWHDGVGVDPHAIPLLDDGGVHRIRAVISRQKDKFEAEASVATLGRAG